ncbi:MAG: metal ABC transporter permease [Phycisphaerae bacterium]
MTWDWALDGWVLVVGVLSACTCALLGNYLVLRKMSMMGDAISHAVLPGLAVAFILSNSRAAWPMFIGAVVVGVLTALLTEAITRYGKVEHGAAMGVVFSMLFAVGLVLLRRAVDHVDLDPDCVLYGNIVLIPLDALGGEVPPAVVNLSIVMAVNLLFVGLFYKELKLCAFDPALATSQGINAQWMHYALMILVAVTTVANFEAVGSILVIAMLIVPPATAFLLTDRLGVMIVLSLIIAALSAVLGHIVAIFGPGWAGMTGLQGQPMSANTSAMMAVVAGVGLIAAVFLSPRHGVISRAYHRWVLSMQILRQDILGLLYRWAELRPERGRPMQTSELLVAVGGGWGGRWALRALQRSRQVQCSPMENHGIGVQLTPQGAADASKLVRSHRLWEAYLAKHFHLPLDHLHAPAERMEHFITPDLNDQLRHQLTDPTQDPHGREIPGEDNPN